MDESLGRVAAVDYGQRRIGLAVTDPLGITTRGLETLRVEGGPVAAAQAVWAVLAPLGVRRVVVGLPLHASGEESPMSAEARRFGDALAERAGLPLEYLDEGLTSWAAEEGLGGRALREAQQTGEVDRRAALALLRSWLQERG